MKQVSLGELEERWDGKIVAFRSSDFDGVAVMSPRFEEQAGVLFVEGEVAPDGSKYDGMAHVRLCLRWDLVAEHEIYDSLEEYQTRMKITEAGQLEQQRLYGGGG